MTFSTDRRSPNAIWRNSLDHLQSPQIAQPRRSRRRSADLAQPLQSRFSAGGRLREWKTPTGHFIQLWGRHSALHSRQESIDNPGDNPCIVTSSPNGARLPSPSPLPFSSPVARCRPKVLTMPIFLTMPKRLTMWSALVSAPRASASARPPRLTPRPLRTWYRLGQCPSAAKNNAARNRNRSSATARCSSPRPTAASLRSTSKPARNCGNTSIACPTASCPAVM